MQLLIRSRMLLPIIAGSAAVGAVVVALLLWLTTEIDRTAYQRQERLLSLIVSQMQSSVAHDQESATVWDDAVERVRQPDMAWMDQNLGTWMHTYFGHDGAFVLKPDGRPLYAFIDSTVVDPSIYDRFASQIDPLIAALRAKLRKPSADDTSDRVLSVGVSDIAIVSGRPAIVSVKPIVSDTGEIEQAPGSEYVHVAIRYLNGAFVEELKRDYLLEGLRFSWQPSIAEDEAVFALTAETGEAVGQLIWKPFRPGHELLVKLAPALGVTFFAGVIALCVTFARLRTRSQTLRLSEAANRHMALHDSLTALPNRLLFNQKLDRALAVARQDGAKVAVLYLDLDRFKQVNDTLGHPAGDELIRQFARRLSEFVRPMDTVARVGGDEFVILLPVVSEEAGVAELCDTIIASLRVPFDIAGHQVFVGVSIGMAIAPEDGADRVELTRRADVALYHAKTGGRARFARFSLDMDNSLLERRGIERDLRLALSRPDELQVHYQPLFASSDRAVTGVEALVRWNHPVRGWIAPGAFVPVAEEAGLIERLGERVLYEACMAAKAWPDITLAVNVSALELRNTSYALRVADILLNTGFLPQRLELEVTESAFSEQSSTCEENVRALRAMGIRIALDDFGTGFSSLTRLQQLTVDRIKIDRSFVQGFGKVGSDEAIVQAIVDLAKATGMRTTGEGVETPAQGEFLERIGCDELQGYLLSRPLTRDAIDGLLGVRPAAEAASA